MLKVILGSGCLTFVIATLAAFVGFLIDRSDRDAAALDADLLDRQHADLDGRRVPDLSRGGPQDESGTSRAE